MDRARILGIEPNTVMFNTALSALGKAGRVDAALKLFRSIPQPDSISHETMVAAYGMSGCTAEAEAALIVMLRCGFMPRDFAYCALIQAYRCGVPQCCLVCISEDVCCIYSQHWMYRRCPLYSGWWCADAEC